MRQFYQSFPKRNAVRTELSWTHYRALLQIDNAHARDWYLHEAINQSWSARALERQISPLYYKHLLASQDKSLVEAEAQQNTQPLAETAKDYLRYPYILGFLNLQDKTYQESQLEQPIIGKLRHQDIGQMNTYVRLYDEQQRHLPLSMRYSKMAFKPTQRLNVTRTLSTGE